MWPKIFVVVAGFALFYGIAKRGYTPSSGIWWMSYAAYLGVAAVVWALCQ